MAVRHILVLLTLLVLIGSASAVAANDGAAFDDALKVFEQGLIDVRPQLTTSLNQHERDVADQVAFEFDRKDLGVAPQAKIENGRRIVRFPLGFVFALGVFSRSLAMAYCCDSRVQAGLENWFTTFDAGVKQMEAEKSAPLPRDYPSINNLPSLCETVLKDRNRCLSFQTEKMNPLHDLYWQTSESLSNAIFVMVSARELSEHLLGHLAGDANENMDSYDKARDTDRKAAEIYYAALQKPYFASPAFAFSVIVEGEGIVPDDRVGHPSTLCRSLAVNAVIFQRIVNDLHAGELMHLPGLDEKRQAFQANLDKIQAGRHDRCSNN